MSGDLVKRPSVTGLPEAYARIEALERENAELRDELKKCHKEKTDLVLKAYPAMDQRDAFEKAMIAAFGLLWRDVNAGPLSIEARKILSALLTKEQKAEGINEALGRYGDPHEGDVLAAVDRAFPPEYVRAEAQAAHHKARAESAEARVAELERECAIKDERLESAYRERDEARQEAEAMHAKYGDAMRECAALKGLREGAALAATCEYHRAVASESREARLREALEKYRADHCEGWCANGGAGKFKDCGGCPAAAALKETQHG